MSLVWVLSAVLLGCLLVYRWADLSQFRPRWAGWLLVAGAGAACGIGFVSCLFLAVGVGLGSATAAMMVEIAALVWSGYEALRKPKKAVEGTPAAPFPLLVPLAVALVLAIGVATAAMATAWESNPEGNWDAWAIWNLRARFLASGPPLAQRVWSAELGRSTHVEYPLLISSSVARAWTYGRSFSMVAPAATSYIFWLALLALAAGATAALRERSLGLMAALVLATSPALLHEVPAQYADVPLACYFAGSILFALLDRPILAGLFAGFAAWTKDEGLLFVAVVLIAMSIFKRPAVPWAAAGAAPGALLAMMFKLVLVKGSSSLIAASLPGMGQRIADLSRYGKVLGAFWQELVGMAQDWYHPIVPLLALAIVLRFDRARRADLAFCGTVVALLLVGYFGIYIITANDLNWQLQSSLGRLLVQVWPCFVVAAVIGMRPPEAARIAEPVKGKGKKNRA